LLEDDPMPMPWENPALPYAERQRLRNEYIAQKTANAAKQAAHTAALAKRATHAAGVVKQQAKQTKITAAQTQYQKQVADYQRRLRSYNNAAGASAMAGAFGHGFAIGAAPVAPVLPKLLQDAAGSKYITPPAPAPKPSNNEGRVTPAPSPAPAPTPVFNTGATDYLPDPSAMSYAGEDQIDAGDVGSAVLDDQAGGGPSPWVLGGLFVAAIVLYAWAHSRR
jgi:hypothetical protein